MRVFMLLILAAILPLISCNRSSEPDASQKQAPAEGSARRMVCDLIVRRGGIGPGPYFIIPERIGREIASLEGVAAVCPSLIDEVSLDDSGDLSCAIVGWPAGGFLFDDLSLVTGDRLSDKHRGQKALMLGKKMADRLKLQAGSHLNLLGESFLVVGIFKGRSDEEDHAAVMLLEDAQKFTGRANRITECAVRLRDPSPGAIETIKAQIEKVPAKLSLAGKLQVTAQWKEAKQ